MIKLNKEKNLGESELKNDKNNKNIKLRVSWENDDDKDWLRINESEEMKYCSSYLNFLVQVNKSYWKKNKNKIK